MKINVNVFIIYIYAILSFCNSMQLFIPLFFLHFSLDITLILVLVPTPVSHTGTLTATTLSMRSCGIFGSSGVGWYFSSSARSCRELSLKQVDEMVAMSSGADCSTGRNDE